MNIHRSTPIGSTRQRGAVSIMTAALLMALLLVMVLVLDGGRLYLEQRKLQKIADMVALSAVARMPPGGCNNWSTYVTKSELENLAIANQYSGDGSLEGWFANPACLDDENLKITVSYDAPTSLILQGIFPDTTLLSASATASMGNSEPIAAFMVSNSLLEIQNDRLIGELLGSIGVGIDQLTVAGSGSLLNTTITPRGLLEKLDLPLSVDDLSLIATDSLLKAKDISIKRIITASLEAAGEDALALSIADSITTVETVDLFGPEGIFKISAGNDDEIERIQAGLDTQVTLNNLLGISALAANRESGLSTQLDILGLANISIRVIEPPAFAIGPVGTYAETSQIRVYIEALGIPLTLNLVSAKATITDIMCEAPTQSAKFKVESGIIDSQAAGMETACVAHENKENLGSCSNQSIQASINTLIGRDNISRAEAITNINRAIQDITLEPYSSATFNHGSSLIVNQALDNLKGNLTTTSHELDQCRGLLGGIICTLSSGLKITLSLLNGVINSISNLLTEISKLTNNISNYLINPLLNLLGIEIGNTQVYLESINCGVPTLVE